MTLRTNTWHQQFLTDIVWEDGKLVFLSYFDLVLIAEGNALLTDSSFSICFMLDVGALFLFLN